MKIKLFKFLNGILNLKLRLSKKNITLGSLLDDTINLKSMIRDISGDVTLDTSNIDGIYRIKYKIDFPTVENFANSSLKEKIQNTFSNSPFKYTTPNFPDPSGLGYAIWPIPSGLPGETNGYYDYSLTSAGATNDNLAIDMEDPSINKDLNDDNSSDIELRGISAPQGKIKFTITLLDDNTPLNALMYGDVTIDKFTLEDKNLTFRLNTTETIFVDDGFGNQVTNKLVFESNIPSILKFNGYINPSALNKPYKYMDVVEFNMKVKSKSYTSFLPAITPTPRGQSANLKLKLDSQITLGNEIYILGPIFPTTFDMGLQEFSGLDSLTSFFDKPVEENQNPLDKLKNRLISSISFANMSLTFDATNDLPFAIDLKKMFNNLTNYKNLGANFKTEDPSDQNSDPTGDNTLSKGLWDSGIYSFYDRTGNNKRDTYSLLSPKKVNGNDVNNDSFLLPPKRGGISIKMEGIEGFFQIDNSRTSPTKYIVPKSIYFGKNVDMRGSGGDVSIDVGIFSNPDLIKLKASIELPISLKLFEATDDIDILKAIMGDSNLGGTIKSVTSLLPLGEIEDLNLEMEVDNSFPFGFAFGFDMIFDQSDDVKKKVVSLLLGSNAVSIQSGEIGTNTEGLYIAKANTKKNIKLGIKKNFKYLDSHNVEHTYNGDLIKLLNESSTVSMSMKLNFMPTRYDSNIVDVVLSSRNSIGVKLIAGGKSKIDLGKIIK